MAILLPKATGFETLKSSSSWALQPKAEDSQRVQRLDLLEIEVPFLVIAGLCGMSAYRSASIVERGHFEVSS